MQVNIIISKNVTSEWRVICRTLWVPMMNFPVMFFFSFSRYSRVELFMFVRYCEVHMYLTCNSHVEFCVNVPLSPEINY